MQFRRDWLRSTAGGALVALLPTSAQVRADDTAKPSDPFILLLKGLYHPVVNGPKLGLSTVNLRDGWYTTTQIYSVFGVPDSENEDKLQPIGKFFVQGGNPGDKCAYQLPGGALAMQFKSGGFTPHPDGQGGQFLEGTFELAILEATGAYRDFQGGHNHMVDKLHLLPDGAADEFCFCIISQYQFP